MFNGKTLSARDLQVGDLAYLAGIPTRVTRIIPGRVVVSVNTPVGWLSLPSDYPVTVTNR